jgi:hypothetical protein
VERVEVRATDAPLAVRVLAAAVLGILILELLGDEEIGLRWDGVPHVLAGLLIHGFDAAEGGRHE